MENMGKPIKSCGQAITKATVHQRDSGQSQGYPNGIIDNRFPPAVPSGFVDVVRADVERHHNLAFQIKHHAQVAFDFDSVDRSAHQRGEPLNLVRFAGADRTGFV
jgi:hypothetical protein